MLRTTVLPGLVTHARNLAASPFGIPFVTIQKLRTPAYRPSLALCSVQGTPS